MVNFRNKHVSGPLALLVALVVTTVMALAWGGTATGADSSRAAVAERPVAHTADGKLRSRVVGTAAGDRAVSGEFVPMSFSRKNGKLFVRGLVQGVIHNDNGSTRTFGVMRKMRVEKINGVPAGRAGSARAASAATCDVLRLVLGPLHLDLLGLQVDLNRVVLNIVAQTGAGNLLGNLVCAVAGLLDGGLNGLLGRIARLLNRILGQLGLGL